MLKRRELLTGAAAIGAMRALPADAQTWAPFMVGTPAPPPPPGNSFVVYQGYGTWVPERFGVISPFYYDQQEFGAGGFAVNQGPNGVVLTGATTTNINASGGQISRNGVANGTAVFADAVADAFTQAMVGHKIGLSGGTNGTRGIDGQTTTIASVEDAGHLTLVSPITPSGTFTGVDWRFNEYIDRATINDSSVFPNNVTMFTNWGSTFPGPPRSALCLVYCNVMGEKLNSNIDFRTQSYVPQPAQVANWLAFDFGYDFNSDAVNNWDVICDYWLTSESAPRGEASLEPGRMFEIDISLFALNIGSFSLIGTRLFTLSGIGAWDGAWYNIGDFGWRFTTARPNPTLLGQLHQSGNVNLLALHQQMMWNGVSTGREYGQGHGLIVEPQSAVVGTLQVNSYTGNWVSNANITIAAGGTGVRAFARGNHFVGAGTGQGSKASFPGSYASYQLRRIRDRVFVRSTNNLSTLDFVSNRTSDGCDQIIFADKTVTITNIPMVVDTALTLKMPFTANQTVGTIQVQASSPVTAWTLTTNPNGNFAISNSGVLTLTAAGAANLSPTTLNYASFLTSSFVINASPGTAVRVVVPGSPFFSTTKPYMSNQMSIRFATSASNGAGGVLDSMYVGRRSGSSGANFIAGQVLPVTFNNGSATLTLAAGAATYVSDPVVFPTGSPGQTVSDIVIGFHVTGSACRLAQGFNSVSTPIPEATFWANNSADIGTGNFNFPSAQGGQLVGMSAIDTGLTQWIDLEVEASNANGKGIGLVTVFNPIYNWFSSGPPTITDNGTTATAVTSANGDMAKTNVGQLFRKYYCELTVKTLDGAGSVGLGITSGGTVTNIVMGSDNNSIGAFADSSAGLIRTNATTVGTMGVNAGNGSVIRMAIDLDDDLAPPVAPVGNGHMAWFAVGNGLWNNTVGADPALGTGGIPINGNPPASGGGVTRYQGGSTGGPSIAPVAYLKKNGTGAVATINTGSSPFAFLCPPGFIGWIVNADGSPPPPATVAPPPSQVPTVVSITPNTGSTAGNRPVTIAGTNFTGTTGVTIGGVPAVGVVVGGGGLSITCRTGRHAVGTASVVVTTPNGSNAANTRYSYVIQAQGVTLSPPAPATAAGNSFINFNVLSFQEEFDDLLSVQDNDNRGAHLTPLPGYNFYTQAWGWPNCPVVQGGNQPMQWNLHRYYSVTNSVLTLMGHNAAAGEPDTAAYMFSTAYVNNAAGYVGTTFPAAGGFYTEVRCSTFVFPHDNIYWMIDNRVRVGQAGVNVDMEADIVQAGPDSTHVWLGYLHRWIFSPESYTDLGGYHPGFSVDSNFYTYGLLFLPPSVTGGNGIWRSYIDGVVQPLVSLSLPTSGPFSEVTSCQYQLILNSDSNSNVAPFHVDYVRVWQVTANG
jgi:hypothetical protein